MSTQRKELEDGSSAAENGIGDGSEGSEISHHSVQKEGTGTAEADRDRDGTESDNVAQLSTQMTKLDSALDKDFGLTSSTDETSTEGGVHTPCSSEFSLASDTKAEKLDDAQNLIHEPNEAKRARLIALAKLVSEKGLSLPPEQGFVSGTTEGWEHGKVEDNIARALGKDNIRNSTAKDMGYEGEGGRNHHGSKKRHVLCHAHNHKHHQYHHRRHSHAHQSHATTNYGDASLTRTERLFLLDAKRSKMQKELDFELIVHALSYPNNHIITPEGPEEGITRTPTPLSALSHQLRLLFSLKCPIRRKEVSSYVWANITSYIRFSARDDYECVVRPDPTLSEFGSPWDHWRDVLSLVLVFACRKEATRLALAFAETRESTAFVQLLRQEKWPSFKVEYEIAKLNAGLGITTIIGVKLIDIPWLALTQRSMGEEIKHSTFEHGFVMGVGPEGLVLWQVWGRAGHDESVEDFSSYSLDEWFNVGGDEVTDFEEGDLFLSILERFLDTTVYSSLTSIIPWY